MRPRCILAGLVFTLLVATVASPAAAWPDPVPRPPTMGRFQVTGWKMGTGSVEAPPLLRGVCQSQLCMAADWQAIGTDTCAVFQIRHVNTNGWVTRWEGCPMHGNLLAAGTAWTPPIGINGLPPSYGANARLIIQGIVRAEGSAFP